MVPSLHQVVPLLMLASSALPTQALGASGCADRLRPDERLVYDAAAARLRSGEAKQSVLRAAAIALVREGKLSMRAAPKAAKAAARCLPPAATK